MAPKKGLKYRKSSEVITKFHLEFHFRILELFQTIYQVRSSHRDDEQRVMKNEERVYSDCRASFWQFESVLSLSACHVFGSTFIISKLLHTGGVYMCGHAPNKFLLDQHCIRISKAAFAERPEEEDSYKLDSGKLGKP